LLLAKFTFCGISDENYYAYSYPKAEEKPKAEKEKEMQNIF